MTDEKTNGTISKFLNGNVDNATFVVFFLFQCLLLSQQYLSHFLSQRSTSTFRKLDYINPFKNVYKVLKYSWKHKVPEHPTTPPVSVWIPSSRRWLLCSRTAPEDQLSFTTSTDTDCTPHKHSCLSGWYTTVSTGDCESVSKTEECSNAYKNVDGSVPLTTSSIVLYIIVIVNHDTTYWQQHHSVIPREASYLPTKQCYIIRTGCEFLFGSNSLDCQQYNDPVDNTYLWFIIPQLLNGLSSLYLSLWQYSSSSVPRLLTLPRGCSLFCGMPPSASGT